MIHQDEFNQTAFSAEEPLYESAGGPSKHKKAELKKPNSGKIILIFIVIIIIAVNASFLRKSPSKNQTNGNSTTPTPTDNQRTSNTSVDKLLQELDQSLESADPSVNIFPFPPVSEEILVSPKQ